MKLDKNEVDSLKRLKRSRLAVIEAIKRKRKLRESERVMWLCEIDEEVAVLDKLIQEYGGEHVN